MKYKPRCYILLRYKWMKQHLQVHQIPYTWHHGVFYLAQLLIILSGGIYYFHFT